MSSIEERALVIVLALLVDAFLGEPEWLWARIPHPVVLIGRAIGGLDSALNREGAPPARRRAGGVFAIASLVLAALIAGQLLALLFELLPLTVLLQALVVAVLVAARSLHDHVAAVALGLAGGGLAGGRAAVARIVGRDPASLDAPAVARAAIESAGENFSDGVVAPVFWFALLGLPGILAYKAINTADSMVGHLTARHRDFGMATARLDDVANFVPARLAGGLIAAGALLAREDGAGAVRAMFDDAHRHRSPNAGWPEAAMAGALGLALAGPRSYGGVRVDDAWLNRGARREAGVADIRRALNLLRCALLAHGAVYALLAILF